MKRIISKIGLKYNSFVKTLKEFLQDLWENPETFFLFLLLILLIFVMVGGIIYLIILIISLLWKY